MIYFISDLHLFHLNVIRFDGRPFSSLEEMHEEIIKRWNSVVNNNDTVIVVGDVSFKGKKEDVEYILKRLKGKIHIIKGNHDLDYTNTKLENIVYFGESKKCSLNVGTYKRSVEKVFHINHFPIAEWNHYFRGSYHIFGHIHNSKSNKLLIEYIRNNPRMLNCGASLLDYTPRTFKELIEINKNFYNRFKCIEIYQNRSLRLKTVDGDINKFISMSKAGIEDLGDEDCKIFFDTEEVFLSDEDFLNKILESTEADRTLISYEKFIKDENMIGESGTIKMFGQDCEIVFY